MTNGEVLLSVGQAWAEAHRGELETVRFSSAMVGWGGKSQWDRYEWGMANLKSISGKVSMIRECKRALKFRNMEAGGPFPIA